MTPLLGLTAFGLWTLRRDPRAWVLLAGPILYFGLLHTAFASSMRYRTPAEAPAMGLAAVGLGRAAALATRRRTDRGGLRGRGEAACRLEGAWRRS